MDSFWASNIALLAGSVIVIATLLQLAILLYSSLRNATVQKSQHQASIALLRQRVEFETIKVKLEHDKISKAWSGIRKFSIARKVNEGQDICSFYLTPHDGKALPPFEPGQYLTFQLKVPGRSKPLVRCYSLSDSPLERNHYRVSIKKLGPPPKMPDAPPGQSSYFFHEHLEEGDVLDVKAPSGKFFLDQTTQTPIVLIGGGIGVTPMLSMLGAVCDSSSQRETWFFYGVRNGSEHILPDHLKQAEAANENVHLRVCYSESRQSEGYVSTTINAEPRTADLVRIEEIFTIGRDEKNDFTIDDEKISRRHARIIHADEKFILTDSGSSNGTYINDSLVSESAVLADKDKITVGNSSFLFRLFEDVLGQDYHHDGWVGVDLLKQSLPSNNYDFFICGPPPMMEAIVSGLRDWGVPQDKIHFEAFGPASIKSLPDSKEATELDSKTKTNVIFAKSGKTVAWQASAGSILDLAEANDIEIDFGCRAGSCGTCMTAIHSGEVNYLDEPEATPDDGTCLACIATPKSELTIDA